MSTPLERAEQPAPVDRAAILREGANALASLGPEDSLVSGPKAWNEAIEVLRRMADEAQQPERCANCGLEIENRGDPSMDGNHHVRWVHVPGGYAICHPQQPDSPRAAPRRADQPAAPADACQFHAPAGDPCAADGCGHAAGDDCHPRES